MDHLPPDSALRRAIHGDEFVEWSKIVNVLSEIRYLLEWANYQRAEGRGQEPTPEKPPVPWDLDPLPSVEEGD